MAKKLLYNIVCNFVNEYAKHKLLPSKYPKGVKVVLRNYKIFTNICLYKVRIRMLLEVNNHSGFYLLIGSIHDMPLKKVKEELNLYKNKKDSK